MTLAAPPFGATRPRLAPPPAPARAEAPGLVDTLCFVAGVLIVLVYSNAWVTLAMGGHAPETGAPSAFLRSLYYPGYAAAVGVLVFTTRGAISAALRAPLLLLLLALTAVSVTWSVDPDITSRRVIALSFTTLSGVVLASRFSWATLTEVFAASHVVLTTGCLLAAVLVPSFGVMGEPFPGAWRGLWAEKNMLGGNMAFATCVLIAAAIQRPERRRLWGAFALLAGALVLSSTSKTSLMAVLIGCGATAFVYLIRRGPATAIAATWAAVMGIVTLTLLLTFGAELLLGALGKDATLTGRTEVWTAIERQLVGREWTGFGYGAIWDNTSRWAPLAWIEHDAGFRPVHAHNGWLEVWLGFGLIGVIVWGAYLLETWIRTLIATYRPSSGTGAYLALPTLCMFTLMTFSESIVINYNDLRWVMFTAIAVKLAAPKAWLKR